MATLRGKLSWGLLLSALLLAVTVCGESSQHPEHRHENDEQVDVGPDSSNEDSFYEERGSEGDEENDGEEMGEESDFDDDDESQEGMGMEGEEGAFEVPEVPLSSCFRPSDEGT